VLTEQLTYVRTAHGGARYQTLITGHHHAEEIGASWVRRLGPPLITSRSTGGCSGSPRSSSRRRGRAATLPATAGSSMRPASRSPVGGLTSTGAVDQYSQVIDVLLSARHDLAARGFFARALGAGTVPVEVTHANNPVEADHGRLKARLRPMRGLKRHRSARILAAGHAFVQNLRRGHYDIATETPNCHRLRRQRLGRR